MALYIPPAVNMLIPRGTFGGAGQQPRIRPTIIILHTNASNTSLAGAASLMANTTKGQEYHCQQEAPGTGRVAGRIGQYVDFEIRADNNYKANSFNVGGTLCGAISIETADHGTPYEKSWTDLGQRQNLEDLCVWLCRTLNIPARRCPGPFDAGIGYHSMWGYNTSSNPNVNPWTNAVGKICPGPGKIREFPDLLARVAQRVAEGDDMPLTDTDVAKIWNYLLPARFGQPASEADVTVKDTRVVVSQIVDRLPALTAEVDTLEESIVALNNRLTGIEGQLVDLADAVSKIQPGEGGGSGGPLTVNLTGTATPAT